MDTVKCQHTLMDKRSIKDRRDSRVPNPQIVTTAIPKKEMERMERTHFFLPVNTYVRSARMTEDDIYGR